MQYWQGFTLFDSTNENACTNFVKPAIFAFSGAAYQGLQANLFLEKDQSSSPETNLSMNYLQSNLAIIDPLYGVLRPLDMMQPYRLEMATKGLTLPKSSFMDTKSKSSTVKLSEFWKPSVTAFLNNEINQRKSELQKQQKKGDDGMNENAIVILNLASDEYASAVDSASLIKNDSSTTFNVLFIKVLFQQEGRVIAVHAKRARGLMVRYLALNRITTLEGVQEFNEEGYKFVKSRSSSDTLCFDRKKQAPASSSQSVDKSQTKKKTSKKKSTDETKEKPSNKRSRNNK